MDRNFTLGGREFQLSKLDPFKQFHIVRRVGPIMADLLAALKSVGPNSFKEMANLSEEQKLDTIAKFATPVINGLSKLDDKDSEFVLRNLLASVSIKQTAGNWAQVATPEMLMMNDLDLPVLLQIAGRAFMFNLSGFTAVHLQSS